MAFASIILAAGGGTRMKSSLPKVLHPICGKHMIFYVLKSSKQIKPNQSLVILGHEAYRVKNQVPELKDSKLIIQKKLLGTAHAVLQAKDKLKNFKGNILVLYGDTPLIKSKTLKELLRIHKSHSADVTLITAKLDNPSGYGRIIRDEDGHFTGIVEEADASRAQKKITEINTGIYIFKANMLLPNLTKVSHDNTQKEYYLTDVVTYLIKAGAKVQTIEADSQEILGINSQEELARASKIMRERINAKWMRKGVTLIDPESTYIDHDVKIANDTVILPNTFLAGNTKIASACRIGPFCQIVDSKIGYGAKINASYVEGATIEEGATIGPFSHLRPGTVIKSHAKVGAFSEVKKSTVGQKSKVPHLSYIGDAEIGKDVNIGAGTITCNYNGQKKYKTKIDDEAFIGSDTMLVAPVKVGKKAVTGAGSVITSDVPSQALGIERTEQKIIKNYRKNKKSKSK